MGCFNKKCGLTQLPIQHGDPVVLLLGTKPDLSERGWDGGGSQLNYFKLLTTPIYGNYNDYGWIEKIDQDSIDAAAKMLSVLGYDGSGLYGDHWDDCLSSLTEGLTSNADDNNVIANSTVSYTFVHRKAWNNLLAYGRHHMLRARPNKSTDADIAVYKEKLPSFGFIKLEVDEYDKRKVFSAWSNPMQYFQAALALIPDHLKVPEDPEMPDASEDIPIEERLRAMQEYAEKSLKFMRAGDTENIGVWLSHSFAWFFTVYEQLNTLGRPGPIPGKLQPLVDAANNDPVLSQGLEDSFVIYSSLIENRIVIREHEDMPDQSQDSTFWGHIAINKAVSDIIRYRASRYDDEDNLAQDTDDPVEKMALSELRKIY